jgi:NADH:ubiquinone oxidoreductase subunit B-like Fe-S oxidoreductase
MFRLPSASEALLEGLMKLQEKISGERSFADQKRELLKDRVQDYDEVMA